MTFVILFFELFCCSILAYQIGKEYAKGIDMSRTIGEIYGPAMEIYEQDKANEYFESIVLEHMENWGKTRKEAEDIVRINLGYYAGYYNIETMERINRLFRTAHPILG